MSDAEAGGVEGVAESDGEALTLLSSSILDSVASDEEHKQKKRRKTVELARYFLV